MLNSKEISKLCKVSIDTLIALEKVGLVTPAIIDAETEERWYLSEHIPLINRILLLKDLGISNKQVSELLDRGVTLEEMQQIFHEKQMTLQKESERETRRLTRVNALLEQLANAEKTTSTYRVISKNIPAQTVASLRKKINSKKDVQYLIDQVLGQLKKNMVKPSSSPIAIYHDNEYHDQNIDVEVAVPIRINIKMYPKSDLIIKELPEIKSAATVVHSGSCEFMSAPYIALFSWIEKNNYCIVGPNREVHLQTDKQATSIIEAQLPFDKTVGRS